MIATKAFNNNAVLVSDNGEEYIVTGNGVGFNVRSGDKIKEEAIEKIYVLAGDNRQRYMKIFSDKTNISFYETAETIMSMAAKKLNCELYHQSVMELADHISFVIDRINSGQHINFSVNNELMSIYPEEYQVAIDAIKLIEENYKVYLSNEEAGFITFHIVSAEKDRGNDNPLRLMSFIQGIMEIIEQHYPKIYRNRNSFTYSRMIMHLRFLGNRVLKKEELSSNEVSILLSEYLKDRKLKKCVNEIDVFIKKKYD